MKYPKVKTVKFEPEMDKPINSALLRAIFSEMWVLYDPESDSFTAKGAFESWGVAVEDEHDDHTRNEEPHYYLEVGEGEYRNHEKRVYRVRYCDFLSTDKGAIEPNPGEWRIFIWVPDEIDKVFTLGIASKISSAYAEVMERCLPDYEIISSDIIVDD